MSELYSIVYNNLHLICHMYIVPQPLLGLKYPIGSIWGVLKFYNFHIVVHSQNLWKILLLQMLNQLAAKTPVDIMPI